jgi:hypothetical protein
MAAEVFRLRGTVQDSKMVGLGWVGYSSQDRFVL